eukprot:172892-Prymnesium_polylepis.1
MRASGAQRNLEGVRARVRRARGRLSSRVAAGLAPVSACPSPRSAFQEAQICWRCGGARTEG